MKSVRIAAALLAIAAALASCGTSQDGGAVPDDPATTAAATTSPATTSPATTGAVTTTPPSTGPIGAADCPVVVAVELVETSTGVFRVSATVRSVDVEDVSYADAWEVRDMAGNVLGTRVLTHPHPNEQPFTRSLSDVAIPNDVTEVVVDARDSARGYCGTSLKVEVPRS